MDCTGKLIKVAALDGIETWVLIHVEVQGEPEDSFAERMFTYQYRLRDRILMWPALPYWQILARASGPRPFTINAGDVRCPLPSPWLN